MTKINVITLWQYDMNEQRAADPNGDVVAAFVAAHGVDPDRLPVPGVLKVIERPDDSVGPVLWLRVLDEGYPICEGCGECIRSTPTEVPLRGALPEVGYRMGADRLESMREQARAERVAVPA